MEILCVWLLLLYRRARYGYAFRIIPLTRGKYAIVDPDDFERINSYKWHTTLSKGSYHAGRSLCRGGKQTTIQMHRQIISAPKGSIVDHININGLDNRKANLRIATGIQNLWNSRRGMNSGRSKYKGVSWISGRKKWRVVLCNNREKIQLGYFDDEKEAAKVYNEAALKYRGEFAVLNDI